MEKWLSLTFILSFVLMPSKFYFIHSSFTEPLPVGTGNTKEYLSLVQMFCGCIALWLFSYTAECKWWRETLKYWR